jgi:hypothetical protein
MAQFTRGFTGKGGGGDVRLPPGQYDTGAGWPVLTAEATPTLSTDDWSFTIEGLVQRGPGDQQVGSTELDYAGELPGPESTVLYTRSALPVPPDHRDA